MIEPTEADIGRRVIYRDRSGFVMEEGTITSFNGWVVFVRYGADSHSKATDRDDLEWVRP